MKSLKLVFSSLLALSLVAMIGLFGVGCDTGVDEPELENDPIVEDGIADEDYNDDDLLDDDDDDVIVEEGVVQ